MDADQIKAEAMKELAEEKFRQAVEAEKERLRKYRPMWHRLFPWEIKIKRR
jgi:hypothetical protein